MKTNFKKQKTQQHWVVHDWIKKKNSCKNLCGSVRKKLTFVCWRVPEGLVELGKVQDHQQLIRLRICSHLLSCRHRLDAKLSLSHIKRQLIVPRHVLLVQRVIITEMEKEMKVRLGDVCIRSGGFFIYIPYTENNLEIEPFVEDNSSHLFSF